jgi:hypothetical protein
LLTISYSKDAKAQTKMDHKDWCSLSIVDKALLFLQTKVHGEQHHPHSAPSTPPKSSTMHQQMKGNQLPKNS